VTQRKEKENEEVEGDLRRFKDSRTLSEKRTLKSAQKVVAQRVEETKESFGWLVGMSVDKCVLGGRMQKGSKSDVPNSGRPYRARVWL